MAVGSGTFFGLKTIYFFKKPSSYCTWSWFSYENRWFPRKIAVVPRKNHENHLPSSGFFFFCFFKPPRNDNRSSEDLWQPRVRGSSKAFAAGGSAIERPELGTSDGGWLHEKGSKKL